MIVKSRLRVTRDGGQSLLAVSDAHGATHTAPTTSKTTDSTPAWDTSSTTWDAADAAWDAPSTSHIDRRWSPASSLPPAGIKTPHATGLQTPPPTQRPASAPLMTPPAESLDKDIQLIGILVDYLTNQASTGCFKVGFDKARKFMIQNHGMGGTGASKRLKELFRKADQLGRVKIEQYSGSKLLSLP